MSEPCEEAALKAGCELLNVGSSEVLAVSVQDMSELPLKLLRMVACLFFLT